MKDAYGWHGCANLYCQDEHYEYDGDRKKNVYDAHHS